ncbi:MAG: hypothetical protein LQ343_000417, partial [Gyalolechia ehrenbergii]
MSVFMHHLRILRHQELVAYWQDSFLPGYLEVIYYFPPIHSHAVRVVPASDFRAANL